MLARTLLLPPTLHPTPVSLGAPCPPSRHRSTTATSATSSSSSTTSTSTSTSTPNANSASPSAVAAAFRTVPENQTTGIPARIEGTLPPWLSGSYIRNGPGIFDNFIHLFDGYGLLCKVEICPSRTAATFTHRFVESKAYQAHRDSGGTPKWREFGTPLKNPPGGIIGEVARTLWGLTGMIQAVTDNASVNVLPWYPGSSSRPRSLYVSSETVVAQYEVDPETLATGRQIPYDAQDGVSGQLTTAHPGLISGRGEGLEGGRLTYVNIANDPTGSLNVFSHRAGDPTRTLIAALPHRHLMAPNWIHAFPCCNEWVVIPQYPATFNLASLTLGHDVPPPGTMFLDWHVGEDTLFTAVKLDGSGERRTFTTPPHFSFHFGNCFVEEGSGNLVFDASVYDDLDILDRLRIPRSDDQGPEGGHHQDNISSSRPRRFTLPLALGGRDAATAHPIPMGRPLVDENHPAWPQHDTFEFPAINPWYRSNPRSNILYGVTSVRPTRLANAICKIDASRGLSLTVDDVNPTSSSSSSSSEGSLPAGLVALWHEPGAIPTEPCFVPRPDGQTEDDGVVVSMVIAADGHAYLLVLDGRDLSVVAKCHVDYALPYGFHGGWVPAAGHT